MATPPDFTAGSVLTAAQMNAVGLWRITECTVTSVGGTAATASNGVITIGNGNTSVTVSSAFSSDYQSYRIIFGGVGASSSSPNFNFSLSGITGSVYYTAGTYLAWANTTINAFSPAATTSCLIGTVGLESSGAIVDLHSPNETKEKYGWTQSADVQFALSLGWRIDSTTSATGFVVSPASGSLTGGTIRVYGYRK